jgi:GH24 family phage-related lysozyme (muramidase)
MPAETPATTGNSTMKMSGAARARMRERERPKYFYYNDMGGNRGNCTWGIGTLEHRGPCTADELKREVSPTQAEAVYSAKIGEAEREVRRRVAAQTLTQAQFDALVSFTYNMGPGGARDTLELANTGDMKAVAAKISSMIRVRVKAKKGMQWVVARGLISRRAEESAPFRTPGN